MDVVRLCFEGSWAWDDGDDECYAMGRAPSLPRRTMALLCWDFMALLCWEFRRDRGTGGIRQKCCLGRFSVRSKVWLDAQMPRNELVMGCSGSGYGATL